MNKCSIANSLLSFYYHLKANSFTKALEHPEEEQRKVLQRILSELTETERGQKIGLSKIDSYETYASSQPISTYGDWKHWIDSQRTSERAILCREIKRFEPTSGSTHERKWIPYSSRFLKELNLAAAVWLGDLYKQFPRIKNGRHFWSISWVPADLRGMIDSNDAELFPRWQKKILEAMMLTHPAIPKAPTSESAWHATLLLLGSASDLSFISVWSPTYLLKVIEGLYESRHVIANSLRNADWGAYQKQLEEFDPPRRQDFPTDAQFSDFVKKLWPHLELVSCWTSSTSKVYAKELQELLPHVPIQGKGLWATEGVVSIPFAKAWPLAIQSHFMEFIHLSDRKIYPVWELQKDWIVQPLLTTSSGLLRYALPDRLRVTGFLKKTPTVEFLGRLGGADLVGEKMDYEQADAIINQLRQRYKVNKMCLIARADRETPQYSLLVESGGDSSLTHQLIDLEENLEVLLQNYHHYKVARETGQLKKAKVQMVTNDFEWQQLTHKSGVVGQNKPESLLVLPSV